MLEFLMLNSPYICNIYLNQSFNIFLSWICLIFFKGIFKSHISYYGVAQKERFSIRIWGRNGIWDRYWRKSRIFRVGLEFTFQVERAIWAKARRLKVQKNRKYFISPGVWDMCSCLGTKVRTHVSNCKCLYE